MKGEPVRLRARETQIVNLLMRGCDNGEIARQLKIARRTVKAHLERLFRRFRITGGIKRVKLAILVVSDATLAANESHESIVSTKREQQVIQLVAEGLKNREVAEAIGIKEHIVKNYLRVVYDKLGLWNRVELALWYHHAGSDPLCQCPTRCLIFQAISSPEDLWYSEAGRTRSSRGIGTDLKLKCGDTFFSSARSCFCWSVFAASSRRPSTSGTTHCRQAMTLNTAW